MSAAEKTPHKCNGISVPEPRCDVEILMQIFCPMFPVSMPFGHQKPQQNKTVPETASTDKVSMIWWEANENYPSSHTQDVIYFHNHSPLFPFHPLDQISAKSPMGVWWLGNNFRSWAVQDLMLGEEITTVKSETVFMHIAGEEHRQREALPNLQCKSFFSCF